MRSYGEPAGTSESGDSNLPLACSPASDAYLAHLLQASPFAICTYGPDGDVVTANQACADLVGTTLDEYLHQNFRRLPSWVASGILPVAERALAEGREHDIETYTTSTYGRSFWVRCRFVPFEVEGERHLLMAAEDVTPRKEAEAELRSYAQTQAVLLREVNHRVSNNLAALLGIIHLEAGRARTADNTAFIRALDEIDSRVRSLSVVHHLLSSREWRPVSLRELCTRIVATAILNGGDDALRVIEHDPPVLLQPEEAQSLGLVLNELGTNTFKYGHLGGDPRVDIEISRGADNEVTISYRDHGPGFPPQVIERDSAHLGVGMELVQGIVEQTLGGRLALSNGGGARVDIHFHHTNEGSEIHE